MTTTGRFIQFRTARNGLLGHWSAEIHTDALEVVGALPHMATVRPRSPDDTLRLLSWADSQLPTSLLGQCYAAMSQALDEIESTAPHDPALLGLKGRLACAIARISMTRTDEEETR